MRARRQSKPPCGRARRLATRVGEPNIKTSVTPCLKDRKWIVDSGSCFDIVNPHELKPGEAKKTSKATRPYRMITAAGVVNAERETVVPLACLGSKATAIVMDNSPCVLSLGKRCMQEGFSFVWNAGAKPVLVAPDGRRHTLELQNLVPVMQVL